MQKSWTIAAEQNSNYEVKCFITFGRIPKRNGITSSERSLYKWLRRKRSESLQGKSAFFESDIKLLQDAGLHDEVMFFISKDNKISKLEEILSWLKSLPVDKNNWHKSPEFTSYATWLRYRHVAVNPITEEQRQKCKEAGFEGLLNEPFSQDSFRNFVYVVQAVRFTKTHGKNPSPSAEDKFEKAMAVALQYPEKNIATKIYIQNNATVPAPSIPATGTMVLDFNTLRHEIDALKSQVAALTEQLNTKLAVKKNPDANYAIPGKKMQKICPESEIIGMMHYKTNSGIELILGIENWISYKTGARKYVCRIIDNQNRYTKILYIWQSSKGIQHIEIFDDKLKAL